MKSFIVGCGAKVFSVLRCVSLFHIVHCIVRRKFCDTKAHYLVESYGFVELWVLVRCILSIVLAIFWAARWWLAIFVGMFFVWEIVIYQINVLLFDEYRIDKKVQSSKTYVTPYALRSYRRSVILLILNYIEIVFWFALFYRNMGWAFEIGKDSLDSFAGAFHFSLVTMTGLGNVYIFPTTPLGYTVTSIQMAVGLVMVLLIVASFVSWLPTPKTLNGFETRPKTFDDFER